MGKLTTKVLMFKTFCGIEFGSPVPCLLCWGTSSFPTIMWLLLSEKYLFCSVAYVLLWERKPDLRQWESSYAFTLFCFWDTVTFNSVFYQGPPGNHPSTDFDRITSTAEVKCIYAHIYSGYLVLHCTILSVSIKVYTACPWLAVIKT